MNNTVWKTMFTDDFCDDEYLYYYTDLETAKQIISSNQLTFSPLNMSNDCPEEKVKLFYSDEPKSFVTKDPIDTDLIDEYLTKRYDCIQIISFCQDYHFSNNQIKIMSKSHNNHEKDKYYDVTGRGFSIPCMWAKYRTDSNGVCFVINKHKFDNHVETDTDFILQDKVEYFDFTHSYVINKDVACDLTEKILRIKKQKKSIFTLIKNNDIHLKFNFLSKKIDWIYENEYRYISFKDTSVDFVSVGGLDEYLEGIVINSNINATLENELLQFVTDFHIDKCRIKKISFGNDYATLI